MSNHNFCFHNHGDYLEIKKLVIFRCDYGKAHCADRHLHVAYQGACSTTTTMAPSGSTSGTGTGTGTGTGGGTGPVITGPEAVFDFFCLELSHHPCDADLETICGSDGVTYTNT